MKNTIKTIIGFAALIAASSASAKCVVDGDYLKSLAKKENPAQIAGCDVNFFINDSSLKQFDPSDSFFLMTMGKNNMEVLDLRSADSSMLYMLSLKDSTELKEIKLGDIKRISTLDITGTKITDISFLEDLPAVVVKTDQVITKFPDKDSVFCKGVYPEKVSTGYDKNTAALFKACGVKQDTLEEHRKRR